MVVLLCVTFSAYFNQMTYEVIYRCIQYNSLLKAVYTYNGKIVFYIIIQTAITPLTDLLLGWGDENNSFLFCGLTAQVSVCRCVWMCVVGWFSNIFPRYTHNINFNYIYFLANNFFL